MIALLCLWGWCWDFLNPVGQFMRVGRAKAFLLAIVGIITVRIWKDWHWSLALFYLYVGAIFIHQGLPATATIEMIMITGILFLVPELYKRVSLPLFENIILVTAVVHSVIAILNTQGYYPFAVLKPNNPTYSEQVIVMGLLGQETILAPYLVFASCFSLHRLLGSRQRRPRMFYGCLSLLYLAGILCCGSTMGFLSLFAVGFVIVGFHYGHDVGMFYFTASVLLGCGAIILRPNLAAFSGRAEPWADAWELYQQHPWFGYGTGSWSGAAVQLQKLRGYPNPWIQLHNEYLQGLFEWGVVGMGILALFAKKVFHSIMALQKESPLLPYAAGVALFAANSVGNFTAHIVPLGPMFAFCIYVVLRGDSQADRGE